MGYCRRPGSEEQLESTRERESSQHGATGRQHRATCGADGGISLACSAVQVCLAVCLLVCAAALRPPTSLAGPSLGLAVASITRATMAGAMAVEWQICYTLRVIGWGGEKGEKALPSGHERRRLGLRDRGIWLYMAGALLAACCYWNLGGCCFVSFLSLATCPACARWPGPAGAISAVIMRTKSRAILSHHHTPAAGCCVL